MIQLTRLNNMRLAVNCDLIKYVEEAPDTVLTLVNGEKLVVRETAAQVIERVRQFRRSVLVTASEIGAATSHPNCDTSSQCAAEPLRAEERNRG